MTRSWLLPVLTLGFLGCDDGDGSSTDDGAADASSPPADASPAVPDAAPPDLAYAFPEHTVQAGEELLGLCRSWTLDNATELFVEAVMLTQDEALRHSSWFFVPDTMFDGPDGEWRCSERGFSQAAAVQAGGLLYVQAVAATAHEQRFTPGVAIRVPANARVVGDVHLMNVDAAAVTGHTELALYLAEAAEVSSTLVGYNLSYDGLAIPPLASSRFSGVCDVASEVGGSFGARLHYTLPVANDLATRVFMQVAGGPDDGVLLHEAGAIPGVATGQTFDPPIDLAAATGLEFGCEYSNPRAESVGWGFGDQEMCGLVGFVEAPFVFSSVIASAESAGVEGMRQLFTGACATVVFMP